MKVIEQKLWQNCYPIFQNSLIILSRDKPGEGKYIEKWRLIVPLTIINRTWEALDVEDI